MNQLLTRHVFLRTNCNLCIGGSIAREEHKETNCEREPYIFHVIASNYLSKDNLSALLIEVWQKH